jgi:hypothetical protein
MPSVSLFALDPNQIIYVRREYVNDGGEPRDKAGCCRHLRKLGDCVGVDGVDGVDDVDDGGEHGADRRSAYDRRCRHWTFLGTFPWGL